MSVKSIKVNALLIIWVASFAGACVSDWLADSWPRSSLGCLFNGALLIGFSYLVQRKENQAADTQQLTPLKKVAK